MDGWMVGWMDGWMDGTRQDMVRLKNTHMIYDKHIHHHQVSIVIFYACKPSSLHDVFQIRSSLVFLKCTYTTRMSAKSRFAQSKVQEQHVPSRNPPFSVNPKESDAYIAKGG